MATGAHVALGAVVVGVEEPVEPVVVVPDVEVEPDVEVVPVDPDEPTVAAGGAT